MESIHPFLATFNANACSDLVFVIDVVEVWLTQRNTKTRPTQSHPHPPMPTPTPQSHHPITSPNLVCLNHALRQCCFIFLTVVFMVEPKRMPSKFECSEVNWPLCQWNLCHQRLFIRSWCWFWWRLIWMGTTLSVTICNDCKCDVCGCITCVYLSESFYWQIYIYICILDR